MNIHVHAWQSLRQSFPIRKSEWVAAWTMMGIALVMLLNPGLFSSAGEIYHGMMRFAPQEIWQWLMFIISVSRLVVLFINGAYWRSPHWRAVFAFLSCFVWWQIAAGLAGNLGLGMVAFAGYFMLDALNFKQALTEAGISEGLRDAEHSHARADN
jgi:hypothetical protein